MWGYVSGIVKKLTTDKANYVILLDNWEVDYSKVIPQINNYVDHSLGIKLTKYDITKEVWEHLTRLYIQSNFTKQY